MSEMRHRGRRWRRAWSGARVGLGVAVATCLLSLVQARAQTGPDSYLEFGQVVALGKKDVEIQTFDPRRQRTVQRSFSLTRDTRADVVHVGDTVELIYVVGAPTGEGDLQLRRLLVLRDGVPIVGSSPSLAAPASPAVYAPYNPASSHPVPSSPAPTVPARTTIAAAPSARSVPPAKVPARASTSLPRGSASARGTSAAAPVALAPSAGSSALPAASATQPVALGGAGRTSVPGVVAVPLGETEAARNPGVPRVTGIAHDAPGAECDRAENWASRPIAMSVLDFRYPTEHEEDRSVSGVGGGSGTSVADLVFARLEGDNTGFDLSRGDRQKLFRMDFAGAARMGRQLGVDLVLLGSFVPVDVPQPDPDFPVPAQFYTLRAGVVETCTGELVYKLSSITCAVAASGAQPVGAPACPGSEISVKDSQNPDAHKAEFRAPIDHLLEPFVGGVQEGSRMGTAGVVQAVSGTALTMRISPRAPVRVGVEVSVHATRLAKNPTTNTVHRYQDEEIGRLTIQRVNGAQATGTFVGDVPVRAGDTADLLTE